MARCVRSGAIEFSRDGTILASASADKVAGVWEVKSGRLLHSFGDSVEENGEYGLYSVALSPDGKILGSAGTATTIDLWQLD
jgi:WD40 repeat protein